MPASVIAQGQANVLADARDPDLDVSAARRELDRVERRFHTTCCSRSGSPETRSDSGSGGASRAIPFASAAGRTSSIASSITEPRDVGWTSSCSFPVIRARHRGGRQEDSGVELGDCAPLRWRRGRAP